MMSVVRWYLFPGLDRDAVATKVQKIWLPNQDQLMNIPANMLIDGGVVS